jgi:hypothetical protein
MTPVSGVSQAKLRSESEKRTLSALRALFDTGAPPAPLRWRRSTLLTTFDYAGWRWIRMSRVTLRTSLAPVSARLTASSLRMMSSASATPASPRAASA